jgi:hypothetical protein
MTTSKHYAVFLDYQVPSVAFYGGGSGLIEDGDEGREEEVVAMKEGEEDEEEENEEMEAEEGEREKWWEG